MTRHPTSKAGLHRQNPFAAPYPLNELCQHQPALQQHLRDTPAGLSVDFANPDAVQLLNAALLHWRYGLADYRLPAGNLCPAVPGRLDYLLNLRDLLMADQVGKTIPARKIQLLDVGCGANLIYSLLAACELKWQVIATDIDVASLQHAQQLLAQYRLEKQIVLRQQPDPLRIFSNILVAGQYVDLTVCNPPFHADAAAAAAGTARKRRGLGVATTGLNFAGQSNELWCAGGEWGFLSRMIDESRTFGSQVYWFSSLVSKAENLAPLQKQLQAVGSSRQQIIPMQQGNKQSRILCWSFLTAAQQQLWRQHRWAK
jgi:23S rRNA (adenine1618-N6)-methyltransferase